MSQVGYGGERCLHVPIGGSALSLVFACLRSLSCSRVAKSRRRVDQRRTQRVPQARVRHRRVLRRRPQWHRHRHQHHRQLPHLRRPQPAIDSQFFLSMTGKVLKAPTTEKSGHIGPTSMGMVVTRDRMRSLHGRLLLQRSIVQVLAKLLPVRGCRRMTVCHRITRAISMSIIWFHWKTRFVRADGHGAPNVDERSRIILVNLSSLLRRRIAQKVPIRPTNGDRRTTIRGVPMPTAG